MVVDRETANEAQGPRAIGRLWNLKTGQQASVFVGKEPQGVNSAAVSPDGKYVAFCGPQWMIQGEGPNMMSLWAADKGEQLYSREHIDVCLAFSPDGKTLVLANPNAIGKIDLTAQSFDSKVFSNIKCDLRAIPAFSPDSKEIFVCTTTEDRKQRAIVAVNSDTGRVIREYKSATSHWDANTAVGVEVSRDGKYVVTCQSSSSGGAESAVVVWDRLKGAEIRRFSGFIPHKAAFTADPDEVAGISIDGAYVVWSIETGNVIRKVFPSYKGRNGEAANLGFGREFDRTNRPQNYSVVDFDANGKYVAAASRNPGDHFVSLLSSVSGAEVARFHHLPEPRQWWTSVGENGAHFAKAEHWTPAPDPQNDKNRFWHNVLRPGGSEDATKVEAALASVVSPIRTDVALDGEGAITEDLRPRLFYLGVGVSDYAISDYNLRFAGKDIGEISDFFRGQQRQHYSSIVVKELRDREATGPAILRELDGLTRSCTPQDVAIVCLSGHGALGRNGLYFVPHEGDLESISTCVVWKDLATRIAGSRLGTCWYCWTAVMPVLSLRITCRIRSRLLVRLKRRLRHWF